MLKRILLFAVVSVLADWNISVLGQLPINMFLVKTARLYPSVIGEPHVNEFRQSCATVDKPRGFLVNARYLWKTNGWFYTGPSCDINVLRYGEVTWAEVPVNDDQKDTIRTSITTFPLMHLHLGWSISLCGKYGQLSYHINAITLAFDPYIFSSHNGTGTERHVGAYGLNRDISSVSRYRSLSYITPYYHIKSWRIKIAGIVKYSYTASHYHGEMHHIHTGIHIVFDE